VANKISAKTKPNSGRIAVMNIRKGLVFSLIAYLQSMWILVALWKKNNPVYIVLE
jgi:hypothetical protein